MATEALRFDISAADKSTAAFTRVRGALKGVESGIDRIGRSVARFGAGLAVGTAGLAALTRRAISTTDEIGKTAKAIGVTAEELQELRHAAARAGVATQNFDQSMLAFTKRLGEAKEGTGAARGALAQLGLTMSALEGQSPADILGVVADRLRQVEGPLERNAILADLFSRSGIRMGTMLAEGASAMDSMRQRARDLGLVISNDMVARAEQANDELDDMADVFKVAGQSLALEFMPALRAFAKVVTSPDFRQGVKDFATDMREAIQWMTRNEDTIIRVAGALAGIAVGGRLGPKGAIVGGITGALGPEIAGMMRGKRPTEITVTRGAGTSAFPEGLSDRPDFAGGLAPGRVAAGATVAAEKVKTLGDHLNDLAATTNDRAADIASALGNAFGGAEDAFAKFVTTGKLEFRDLANSMISDLARIAFRQAVTGVLTAALAGAFSGPTNIKPPGFAGTYAKGGLIPSGQFGLVGERGPELISGPAQVTPMQSGGGFTYAPTINAGMTATDRAWVRGELQRNQAEAVRMMQRQQSARLRGRSDAAFA